MRVVFTKCDTPISKLIRWGLEEPISHVGFEFDNSLVVHSSISGICIQTSSKFYSENTKVFSVDILTVNDREALSTLIKKSRYKFYDYPAFLYLCWRGFLKKFFNKNFPRKNKFNIRNSEICTEVIGLIKDIDLQNKLKNVDLSITSPYQLYLLIK